MRPIGRIGPICLTLFCAFATAHAATVTWDTITRLTANSANQVTGRSGQHGLAVDASGDVHVVWLDQRTVPYQVWYRRYDAGTSTWLAETTLTTQQANCSQPGMACDSAGNIHVAWQVMNWNPLGVGTWAKRYNVSTHHWRVDTLIDSTGTSQPQQYPSVACVPGTGDLEVALYKLPDTGMYTQVFLKEWHPATGWDSVVQVSSAAVNHDQVSVAAGLNGDVAVIWVGKDLGDAYSQVYCRRRVGGTWQGVELVSAPAGLSQYSPCAAFDREGAVHVVWHGLAGSYQQVFHRECDAGTWSGVDDVSGQQSYQQEFPSIACDAAGRCHVVWCSQAGGTNYQLAYAQRDTDGVWSSPTTLTALDSGSVNYPSIACDAVSGIHIVWYDNHTGNQDVYYLHGVPAGTGVLETRPSSVVPRPYTAATLVRGVLFLRGSRRASSSPGPGCVLDISGRKVLDLLPGANDVRGLAPGVYFVREAQTQVQAQAVSKIAITR
ncbi:MAG TPA: hypothetical protein VMH22_14010 [bacterium]|nr:hypothetical protein [bacterium]